LLFALAASALAQGDARSDDRGYVYIVDRGGLGMHILELAGAARAIAKLP
jgi:hypothetical protein